MKKLLLTVAGLIAFSGQAIAQDAPQAQQRPKIKPGLNMTGEQQVDPRMEEYRKAVDREYDAALKKYRNRKRRITIPGRVSAAVSQPRSEAGEIGWGGKAATRVARMFARSCRELLGIAGT